VYHAEQPGGINHMDNQTKEIIDQVVEIGTNYGIDVISVLVILILGWVVAGWARRVTQKALARSNKST
jgi:hypothetical protein